MVKHRENIDPYGKKEVIIRWSVIIVFGGLFPFIFAEKESYDQMFWPRVVNSIVRTAVIWHGSMYIVNGIQHVIKVLERPWFNFFVMFISLSLWAAICIYFFDVIIIHWFTGKEYATMEVISFMIGGALVTLLITSIYAGAFFFNQWKNNLIRSQQLEKSNLEAKYETLKNQVNPHFLFNSLNTLMTMVEDKPEAANYLQNLSDFMRYVLLSREKEVVLLRDELNIARKYAFLQQSRFGNNLVVNFKVDERYFHYALPPLALQMLIENAIKHNVISTDKPLEINIFINKNDCLVVENNFQQKQGVDKTGLGLKNIKERYKFLTAKVVDIQMDNKTFKVALPLVKAEL